MKPLGASDPTTVGSYRLIGVLGGGGMGRVYLAESRSGRRLAIKVIKPELAEDPAFRRRFAREVASARSVSPLFTAAVVDADTDAEAPWLATVYIDGPSLEDRITEHGPMDLGAVLTLASGLAEALASIHKVGLVHRDLKPSNVLLDAAGPHIIDFGIAVVPDGGRMTSTLLMGTPSYMAPERLKGGHGTQPGDVFALGATMFYALTGRDLVNGATTYIKILQVTEGRFDMAAVPKELRPVIVRCVSHRPKDRPTADELARIFAASGIARPTPGWYEPTAPPAPVVPLESLPTSPVTRRRLLAGAGTLGFLGLAGGLAMATGLIRIGARPGDRAVAGPVGRRIAVPSGSLPRCPLPRRVTRPPDRRRPPRPDHRRPRHDRGGPGLHGCADVVGDAHRPRPFVPVGRRRPGRE